MLDRMERDALGGVSLWNLRNYRAPEALVLYSGIGIKCTTSLWSTTFERLDLTFRFLGCFKPQDPIVG